MDEVHGLPEVGYEADSSTREMGWTMTNDLSYGLLTVIGVLGGIATLLILVTALDPTNVRREE